MYLSPVLNQLAGLPRVAMPSGVGPLPAGVVANPLGAWCSRLMVLEL